MTFLNSKFWTVSTLLCFLLLPGGRSNNARASDANKPIINYVRELKVHGSDPYLDRKIRRVSTLQSGDTYSEDKVIEAKKRLHEFFEKEGYYGTDIQIEVTPDSKHPQFINLTINIDKGKTHRIGEIDIQGNEAITEQRIYNKLMHYSHFSPRLLAKKLKNVDQLYQKKGYIRAKARLTDAKLDLEKKDIDIFVNIQEKRKLIMRFEGNQLFSDNTLDDNVTFLKEKAMDRFAVERSIEKLMHFYQINGFWQIKIEATREQSEKEVLVVFTIHEGTRARVKKILIDGNKEESDKKISKSLALKENTLLHNGFFRTDLIEEDQNKIAQYYLAQGYLDSQVLGHDVEWNSFFDQAVIIFHVEEGNQYKLGNITIEGNKAFDTESLLKKSRLKTKKPYQADRLEKALLKLTQYYQLAGYPYSKVEFIPNINRQTFTVHGVIRVSEGIPVTIGRISVDGQYNTHLPVILEALKIESGDKYVYKKVLDAQLNLRRLGIFDYVRISSQGIETNQPVVDLLVQVFEQKSLTLDVQGGFDSERLASGQIIFNKRNLFGRAKNLQLKAVGGFALDRGEITFSSPRIFGANWNFVNQYFVQYEDDINFNATSYGGTMGVIKNFGIDLSFLSKLQIARVNYIESESNSTSLARNLFDNTLTSLLFSVTYDTRDNFANPRNGLNTTLSNEFDLDMTRASNHFTISKASFAYYLSPSDRITFIQNFRLGKITKTNSSARVPADKLFFMGGNDTIRGFDEDVIRRSGGTTSIIYNSEINFALANSFKLAGFIDIGSLTDSFQEISADTLRESAGPGLRYLTPVGPIRMDYGFILDRKPGEPLGRFHFSFGYIF